MKTCRRRLASWMCVLCVVYIVYIALQFRFMFRGKQTRLNVGASQRPNDVSKLGIKETTVGSIIRKEQEPTTKFHVIVNSYMRSGSSFIGRLFGFHPEAFYFYEPLWRFTIWDFFKGESSQCHSTTCSCRPGFTLAAVLRVLDELYKCDFSKFKSVIAKETPFYSGKLWNRYTECIHNKGTYGACQTLMSNTCKNSTHVVSKVMRLTLDNYDAFLNKTQSNVKLIHLFRDPRATINSRYTTDWYPMKSEKDGAENAKCLCDRMLYDYKTGTDLQKKYPNNFKFVMYENITADIKKGVESLYKIAGFNSVTDPETYDNIVNFGFETDHALRDNSTDYLNWWRKSMSWRLVEKIDKVCAETYKVLGYRSFHSESQFRNLSVSTVSNYSIF